MQSTPSDLQGIATMPVGATSESPRRGAAGPGTRAAGAAGRGYRLSPRAIARIAGAGYLVIIVAGIFAEFLVRSNLIVAGDAAETAANIRASQGMFRLSIAGDATMLIFDAVVAAALFTLLRPAGAGIAFATTAFRLVHTAVYGATLLTLVFAAELLGNDAYAGAFRPEQLDALALLFAEVQSYGYSIGLIFFGVHVFILGHVLLRTRAVPVVLGVMLLVAGGGYLVDSFAKVVLTNYADYEAALGVAVFGPAVVAELSLAIWLLVKGLNLPRSDDASLPRAS